MQSCRCRKGHGFTLLEVVVGLTLMASVLVGSLLSFSSHRRQQRTADAKIAAVAVADQLLNELSGLREGIPAIGRGMIAGRPNWFWTTDVVGTTAPADIPMQLIRLQVTEVDNEGRSHSLVTVDVVKGIK